MFKFRAVAAPASTKVAIFVQIGPPLFKGIAVAAVAIAGKRLLMAAWAARKAIRRYRFAKGQFGPKRRFRPKRIKKKMKRQSAGTRTAEKHLRRKGPRKGFFHGKHYVDMSHIPEDLPELNLFTQPFFKRTF